MRLKDTIVKGLHHTSGAKTAFSVGTTEDHRPLLSGVFVELLEGVLFVGSADRGANTAPL